MLDAVGYAASIFHRGVRHVRLPTTVLAQADSGVGVKNAVNAFGTKNLVGVFAPPFAIVNDGGFIDHLPPREKRSGMAEAVKVALIRDRGFFEWIEANADALAVFHPNTLDRLIERSAQLHMRQIAEGGDPFETGSARPLDYGHWSAHRLESLTGHSGRPRRGGRDRRRARHPLRRPRRPPAGGRGRARAPPLDEARLQPLVRRARRARRRRAARDPARPAEFQEHLGGELTVTLIDAVGHGVEVNRMDPALIADAIAWLPASQR